MIKIFKKTIIINLLLILITACTTTATKFNKKKKTVKKYIPILRNLKIVLVWVFKLITIKRIQNLKSNTT